LVSPLISIETMLMMTAAKMAVQKKLSMAKWTGV